MARRHRSPTPGAPPFAVRAPEAGHLDLEGRKEDLEALRELLEAGKATAVVDRTFPLREVPEAIRYLREGRARGKVVITL